MKCALGFGGLICAAAFAVAAPAFAADDCCASSLRFDYGASFSYAYDFNTPGAEFVPDQNGDVVARPLNNRTLYPSFEQDEAFNVDLVQLGVSGERGPVEFRAKVDLGDLARVVGDSDDGDIALQEAHVVYFARNMVLTAGRFATPVGYEVLEPWGNAQISRSRAWTQFVRGPSLDGISIAGSIGPVELMTGVVNGQIVQDQAIGANDLNDEKSGIALAGVSFGDLAMSLSGMYGREKETQVQVGNIPQPATGRLDRLFVNSIVSYNHYPVRSALEGNYIRSDDQRHNLAVSQPAHDSDESWNVTLYLGRSLDACTFDVRADYGRYEAPFQIAESSNFDLWSVTGTVGVFLVDGVQIRTEYRHDQADHGIYVENSGDRPTKSDDVVSAQIVWTP